MRPRGAWARAGLVAALVIAADQVTKKLARDGIAPGTEDPVFPALKLVNVRNEGVAFGIDAGGKTLVIVLIALALLALVLYFARHTARPLIWLPTGLL
ncbi:MAG TPA: signal peptidase II, partial [Solirubrobacteraceae bacterium]|nr:signal peptidase II [Solirubrobacteraceae bacterium]